MYAEQLDGTPLTTVRLTATAAALATRARARSRGEMAPLAGDDLVGADDNRLRDVVAEAVREQESRPPSDEHVIDSTTLSAADAATMVLTRAGI